MVTTHVLTRKLAFLVAFALAASTVQAADRMPLSQVEKGMKGYGLTVFEGTNIEKFDVEILGVLHNIGPDQNLILAKVDHPVVARAGVIAGMSGSPIFIDGKVIGALAYAWQFAKEPVAGITPIEEMLKIAHLSTPAGASPAGASPRISGLDLLSAVARSKPEEAFDKLVQDAAAPMAAVSGAQRIALPMSVSSFAPDTVQRFSPYLERLGFVTVPAGAASTSTTNQSKKTTFAPGDPVGAVLLNGDFNVAASGTVSYVDGDHVYAFGHPFLDMGEINFPMATSEVVTVLPSLASSFKFSNTGNIVGVLRQDRAAGIMGILGEQPQMIPVEVTLTGASGPAKTYHVNVVRQTSLAPLMLAMVTDSIVANAQRAAGERTVLMESEIKVKGFEPIRLREGWAGAQARQSIPQYLAIISGYLMSNEFRATEIESVKINLHHDDDLRIARLMEASLEKPEKGRISPGDTVKVRTVLKPFRGEPFVETFDVRIPEDQPAGSAYLLVGSGSVMNAIDFTLVPPDPRTLEQVVDVLTRLRPATDLTVGLYSSGEGAVTSGVYLPNLPPSMRAVVTADTSNGPQAAVKYHPAGQTAKPLGYIVDGALKIDLDVQPAI